MGSTVNDKTCGDLFHNCGGNRMAVPQAVTHWNGNNGRTVQLAYMIVIVDMIRVHIHIHIASQYVYSVMVQVRPPDTYFSSVSDPKRKDSFIAKPYSRRNLVFGRIMASMMQWDKIMIMILGLLFYIL